MGGELQLSYCILMVGSLPCSQNTMTSVGGYSQRHWTSQKNPTGWMYKSQTIDQLLYNQGSYTSQTKPKKRLPSTLTACLQNNQIGPKLLARTNSVVLQAGRYMCWEIFFVCDVHCPSMCTLLLRPVINWVCCHFFVQLHNFHARDAQDAFAACGFEGWASSRHTCP